MGTLLDLASLVTIPSGYKVGTVYSVVPTDGAGDLSFTRSNDTATRVGPNGLIEKVRTNLALRSQSFATSAVWTTANGTITNNAGIAPDGTNTASKIVATDADPFVYQALTLSGSVVVSCYVKGIGSSIGKNGSIRAASSITNFTITADWQRVSLTHTAGGSQNYGVETPESAAVSDEVLLWGFQVETGDVMTDYIPTTTTAVSVGPVANLPRLDYLNSTCPNLLLEPQRTNLVLYSEQFNNAAWSKNNTTVTANATTSPDGYTDADKLIADNGASLSSISNYALQSITKAASAIQYTYSTFVKQGGLNRINIIAQGASISNNASATFSLVDGSIATAATAAGAFSGASASATNYGNGWYRCALVFTTNTDTDLIIRNIPTDSTLTTGNGTNGILIYGAQIEQGAYATSYVPTLGAASTRGADAASKTGVSSLIGQTEGVVFWDINVDILSATANENLLNIDAGSFANTIYLAKSPGGTLGCEVYVSSIGQCAFSYALPSVGRYKMALAYKTNDFAFYVNGVLRGTDSSGSVPATSRVQMGNGALGPSDGNVNQLILFPTRLSNSELAQLTTI